MGSKSRNRMSISTTLPFQRAMEISESKEDEGFGGGEPAHGDKGLTGSELRGVTFRRQKYANNGFDDDFSTLH